MLQKIKELIGRRGFKSKRKKAEKCIDDTDKMEAVLVRLSRKLARIPKAGDQLKHIPIFIMLVRSYIRNEYTKIPYASVVSIAIALVYTLSPFDILSDWLPVIGFIDDALVASYVFAMVKDDVEEYEQWRHENKKEEA